jgi:hypothetical protein
MSSILLLLLYCILLQELYYNRTFCSQYRPSNKYILPVSVSGSIQAPINLVDNSPVVPRLNPVSSSRYIAEGACKSSITRHQYPKPSAIYTGLPTISSSCTKPKPAEGKQVIIAILYQSWYYKTQEDQKEKVRTYNKKVQYSIESALSFSLSVF